MLTANFNGIIDNSIVFWIFIGIATLVVLPFLIFVWFQAYDPETLRTYTWIEKIFTTVVTLIIVAMIWGLLSIFF